MDNGIFFQKKNQSPKTSVPSSLSPTLLFTKFLRHLKFPSIIEKNLTDPRKGAKIYSLNTLFLCAFSTVAFRQKSKHNFDTLAHHPDIPSESLTTFLYAPEKSIPVTKTIDDVIHRLSHDEVDEVLFSLFETLLRSKFFINHPELIPGGKYFVAIDGETVHTYHEDSSHNHESCPFCLKRNLKGKLVYHHMNVVASVVCPGKVRLPLFLYRVHSKHIIEETMSKEGFKQECEFSSLPHLLKSIRTRFPRLSFCFLLDSLYANATAINLLNKYNMEYMIVRKPGSMRSFGADCDGLMKLHEVKKDQSMTETSVEKDVKVVRSCVWLNEVDYQNLKLNVLRYDEEKQSRGIVEEHHWEWIMSKPLSKKNALVNAKNARMRWLEEDLFNSLETREYDIHHDYARKGQAQLVWEKIMMIGYFATELFTLTNGVRKALKGMAIKTWMARIFHQLLDLPYSEIFPEDWLGKRMQFRYYWICGPPG